MRCAKLACGFPRCNCIADEAASPRQVVGGVVCGDVGEGAAGGVPVTREVGAAGDADFFRGAKMFEVGDDDGLSHAAFEPLGRVNRVPQFSTTREHGDTVFPEIVVHEANRERAAE